jgi:hypothetical protein
MCGWPGPDRNGDGRCINAAPCAHRAVLNLQGRPRQSACACTVWPCPCACHDPHGPMIVL